MCQSRRRPRSVNSSSRAKPSRLLSPQRELFCRRTELRSASKFRGRFQCRASWFKTGVRSRNSAAPALSCVARVVHCSGSDSGRLCNRPCGAKLGRIRRVGRSPWSSRRRRHRRCSNQVPPIEAQSRRRCRSCKSSPRRETPTRNGRWACAITTEKVSRTMTRRRCSGSNSPPSRAMSPRRARWGPTIGEVAASPPICREPTSGRRSRWHKATR